MEDDDNKISDTVYLVSLQMNVFVKSFTVTINSDVFVNLNTSFVSNVVISGRVTVALDVG